MVELYIDNTAVVLPSDLSSEIVIANSFFTKNGEYTYDIKLSLKNAINAALYKQLNRLNSVAEVTSQRRAKLIIDNRTYIDGTEIITDWDDDSVSIQLTSGNSELNYFIGSDKLISSLDMGTAGLGDQVSSNSLFYPYPDFDYVLAPVYNRSVDEVINCWWVRAERDPIPGLPSNYYMPNDESAHAQPYLSAMIEKIITALGYTIGINQFATSVFKDLFILNTVERNLYSKMLPGWTAKEFLEEIEKLFNLCFIIDRTSKKCNILFANSFYIGAPEVHLSAVEDEYEVEINEKSDGDVTSANVSYDLPNNDYFRFRRLTSVIKNKAEYIELAGYSAIKQYFSTAEAGKMVIAIDTTNGRKYCKDVMGEGSQLYTSRPIDEFCDLDRGSNAEIKISICPAEMSFYTFNEETTAPFISYIPCIDSSSTTESASTENSIEGLIESGADEVEESKNKIFLAFYNGPVNFASGLEYQYPLSTPDQLPIDNINLVGKWDEDKSLRFHVLNRLLYSGVYTIDTTKTYTFYSSDPNVPDTHSIFVINNKRFVCRELSYTISKAEKVKRWRMKMHPIEISDTEALNRWILSDSKWRDGGVWLDDGRWLD